MGTWSVNGFHSSTCCWILFSTISWSTFSNIHGDINGIQFIMRSYMGDHWRHSQELQNTKRNKFHIQLSNSEIDGGERKFGPQSIMNITNFWITKIFQKITPLHHFLTKNDILHSWKNFEKMKNVNKNFNRIVREFQENWRK